MHQRSRINRAKWMVCASCEWIFKVDEASTGNGGAPPVSDFQGCPKCHWGCYSAHYVYGNRAYEYAKTQKPWLERKLQDGGHASEERRFELLKEIAQSQNLWRKIVL